MTIQKLDKFVRFLNGPIFGCLLPAEIDHSKIKLVRYSDGHCTIQNQIAITQLFCPVFRLAGRLSRLNSNYRTSKIIVHLKTLQLHAHCCARAVFNLRTI
jgi:hypothetical protein